MGTTAVSSGEKIGGSFVQNQEAIERGPSPVFSGVAPVRAIKRHIWNRAFSLACRCSSSSGPVLHENQALGDGKKEVHLLRERVSEFLREQILKILEKVMEILCNLSKTFPLEREIDPNETPTIFIHGFAGSSTDWIYMQRELKGFKNLYVVKLGRGFFTTIDQQAQRVAALAKEIQKQTTRNDLNIVAHSMGGNVARQFRYYHAGDITIRKIITLGSPLKGAERAKWGCYVARSANDLVPGCPALKDHRAQAAADDETHYFHLAAERDKTVFPRKTAWGSKAKKANCFFLKNGTHMNMLFSKPVAAWIGECLRL